MWPHPYRNVDAVCRKSTKWYGRALLATVLASVSLAANAEWWTAAEKSKPPLKDWQYQALFQALRDPVDETQTSALIWLRKNGRPDRADHVPPALLDELGARLSRPRADITLEAMASLGAAGAKFAPQVARLLKGDDPLMRIAAVQALGAMGPASANYAPQFAALLKDSSLRQVREAAAYALGAIGSAGARYAPDVAALLKDDVQSVRLAAKEALKAMALADVSSAPQFAALMKHHDPSVRAAAVRALGTMGAAGASYASEVATLLKDSNTDVRYTAAQALGGMGADGASYASQVLTLLKDSDTAIRYGTAPLALAKMAAANASVAPQVAALLKDGDSSVRSDAVEALGAMGPLGAKYAPQIAALLKDRDPLVRSQAVQALGAIGPAGADYAQMAALLKDGDPSVRVAAVQALGTTGAAGATYASQVARLLKDSEENVRGAAARALGTMGAAGASHASEVVTLLGDYSSRSVRRAAALALGTMGAAGASYASQIVTLSNDLDPYMLPAAMEALRTMGAAHASVATQMAELLKNNDPIVRKMAAQALGEMGSAAASYPQHIVALLKDRSPPVRETAAIALQTLADDIGPIGTPVLFANCLDGALLNRDQAALFRLTCYLLRPLTKEQLAMMSWANNGETGEFVDPKTLNRDGAIAVLTALQSQWPYIDAIDAERKATLNPTLRQRVAAKVAQIVNDQAARFTVADVQLIDDWNRKLTNDNFNAEAAGLREVRNRIEGVHKTEIVGIKVALAVAGHGALWVLLLWAYPRWRPVQAFFFWNRWGRWFVGLGYVGLLIAVVPWLRRRMFIPFRASLVQRGALAGFDDRSYFPDSEVIERGARDGGSARLPLSAILQKFEGQVVLEGESGLGKTTALQRLASTSGHIAVLLTATECREGVVTAIQARLKGQASDESYLRTLVHLGAIDVLIDGLNEATPDTRSRIVQFIEESFRGNFVITTQPMDWKPPRTARVLTLQPLRTDQIEDFLVRQWPALARSAALDEDAYGKAVRAYVAELVVKIDDGTSALRILSNPMEANIVAELLSRGERPDLLRLVEQRFAAMEEEFRARENRPFPYPRFAEQVYAWRASGAPYLDPTGFDAEVAMLVEHKLMVARTVPVRSADATKDVTRWWFRHDRFMEFCLLPAFMREHGDRQRQHVADEAFFGVYDLLALWLPGDEELEFWQFLTENAADTRQNELLTRYTIARRRRTFKSTADTNSNFAARRA